MLYDNKVQTIKDRLTMREVLLHYGYQPNRANFICCPFHNEKTPSMKIYKQDYHCFGCGEHGDIISFVQKLFGLSFPDTLKKIDTDFNLGLFEHISTRKSLDIARQSYQRKKERERQKKEIEGVKNKYWDVYGEYARLFKNKILYEPNTMDSEKWHPLFVEALQKLAYQEYLLDCAESEVYDIEHRNSAKIYG
jgi:DNA primase